MVAALGSAAGRRNPRFCVLIPNYSFHFASRHADASVASYFLILTSYFPSHSVHPIGSEIIFDWHAPRHVFCQGRAWRGVRSGTNAPDLLRAQRNHRFDATSPARRDPAGKNGDTQQEQGDTRESDRIGRAHAVEQALHHARAAQSNDQSA